MPLAGLPAGIDIGLFRTPGFCVFLRLFVRLRWLAVLGTVFVIALFQFVIGSPFRYELLYATVVGILAYNSVFYLWTRQHCPKGTGTEEESKRAVSRLNALLQINLDLFALFWLLHLSGGVENPCVLFFVFHVVIAGILLRPRWALVEALFATFLVFALGVLEKLGALPHYHSPQILPHTELTDSWLFVIGLPAMLGTTIFALSAFTILIMRERHKRREVIVALSEDLTRMNERLLLVDEGRRGLLAVASHDLKSPIAAVAGYLMTLREGYIGPVNARQSEVLDKCLRRLEGLKEFVSDVLSWTAIESGELRLSMRAARLEPLLEQAVESYRDRAAEAKIDISIDLEPDLPEADITPERILQVLHNLLSNAVKYTPQGGVVHVVARASEAGGALIAISDTGIGMSKEDQEHLFEGFFRAPAVRGRYEGTGLGLSLAKGIVEAHRGRIWVESEVGQGSTFIVELPPAAPMGPMPQTPQTPQTPASD